jgi:hypothetical protein
MVHQSDWEVRMHDGLPEFIPPKWIDYGSTTPRRPAETRFAFVPELTVGIRTGLPRRSTRGHDGAARWAQGRSQSRATAAVAAAATGRALSAPHGVHPVHHILTLDDLPAEEIKLDQAEK